MVKSRPAGTRRRLTAQVAYTAISAVIGGVVALGGSLMVTKYQLGAEERRTIEQQRVLIWMDTAGNFNSYISNWNRLIVIAEHEEKQGRLNKREEERKERYVAERDKPKDALYGTLEKAKLFFGKEVHEQIEQFTAWEKEKVHRKRLNELPPITAWEERKNAILGSMTKELKQP